MAQPMITANHVCRYFTMGPNTVKALEDVSVSIQPGQLTILRGRSGSGKTTLLNILGALDMPTKGDVEFDGELLTQLTEAQRDEVRRQKIGFVFQSVALMSSMTARENVEFGLRVAGYDPAKRRERARYCLEIVGLSKRMDHRPHEMSGGEQQRVAIARALAHNPKVIFADEPTAELDTAMGLQIVKVFRELIENEGATVVMTTHDPSMMEIADRVYTLQDGEIIHE